MFFSFPLLFGLLEGVLETSGEITESLSSGSLCLLGSLSGFLDGGDSLLVSFFFLLLLSGLLGDFIRVKLLESTSVLKRVLSLSVVEDLVGLDGSELGLDLVRVDDSGEISAGHDVSVENVAALFNTLGSVVTEDLVEGLEGVSGPDDESAEVTTGGELEEVESVYVHSFNTGEVSGGSLDEVVFVTVDDEGTLSKNVSGVSHLSVADSNSSGVS